MSPEVIIAALLGALIGALFGWLLRERRTRALELEAATLQERLKSEEALARERDNALELAMEQLRSGFQALAGDTLRNQSEVFLKLASERLGRQQEQADGTLRQRQQAIDALVQPIREALQKTETTVQKLESERKQDFGSIQKYLSTVSEGQALLQRETRNLVTALRRPEVRGRWGEITLKRVVELSGMTEHCDFEEQVHTNTADGALRPDMIVHMPDERDLVVDVKTPLDAYIEAIEATTDEARTVALRRHAQALASRVRELSGKSYWAQFERSPEFVVLFIPGEQFLSAALAEQPSLLDDALGRGVILTTPSSLMGLLKTVAYGWRQMSLARNAEEIRRLGEELYKRLDAFQGHLQKVGRSLASSVAAYNDAVGSLERSVLPGARRFPELGTRNDREIARLEAVDREPRLPARPAVTDDSGNADG